MKHPNFNSVRFASDIMISYREALRGDVSKHDCPDIADLVLEFVENIEYLVNEYSETKSLKSKSYKNIT